MNAPPDGWTLSASAFNLTPEVVRAEHAAPDLALTLVERGLASEIEVELGQLWRGYPAATVDEARTLRDRLHAAGGRVSIVGVSIDEWDGHRRRTEDERLAFLEPQLRTSAALGARGVRLPLGQAGGILERTVPLLEELDLVLYEEAQGHQTPAALPADYARIAEIDSPHVRLLLDISMLMPALPVTYLDALSRSGLDPALVAVLRDHWREAETHAAVIDHLRSGRVPGPVHTLYMNLLVRFGRSDIADVASVLPLLGGVHLKFWDLDDADHRLSDPIRDVGTALAATGFTGTLCSEWGGQEWLDDDPWEMTSRHLALAAGILSDRHPSAPPQEASTP
ncbi:restriction endonuclease subunit R [Microbacterium sp. RURRCA19A]|uniref:restriction endonuclease subunit R n=1 Tax=Microbacterium sp. RURRCA19A TaxID=1907391 RepID=UPI0009557C61|nr:restriction endonuclease subunit R [Microbacterium sp. RURRCA19A]SIR98398.1 hypothetical protein SAMN05880568_2191 [Microbacterium sp. RURRCA19A]